VARELRWAGARLHELATRRGLGSEEDHRRLFDELEWGLK
jgi:hypothetical protein